ncbi:MAG: hypothetical protein CMH52_02580 [Myxococcales bacterium]|nr:hypothetical protein [Myxococcales bacterium]
MGEQVDPSNAGQAFLNSVLEHLNVDVEITIKSNDDRIIYELSGDTDVFNTRPALVSALTVLASQAVSRVGQERLNCVIDVDGQLEARRELLEVAADDVARAVVRNGRRAVFEGLNSTERRIIHTKLKEDDTVETFSEGDERVRRLIVASV